MCLYFCVYCLYGSRISIGVLLLSNIFSYQQVGSNCSLLSPANNFPLFPQNSADMILSFIFICVVFYDLFFVILTQLPYFAPFHHMKRCICEFGSILFNFFLFYFMLHLPSLRLPRVGGCWDRTHCDFVIGIPSLYPLG